MPAGQPSPWTVEHAAPFSASTEITHVRFQASFRNTYRLSAPACQAGPASCRFRCVGSREPDSTRNQARAGIYSLGKFGVKGFLSSSHCLFLPGTGPMPHKRAPHFYLNSVPHTVRTTHSTWLFESSELPIFPGTDPASWSPGFFDFGFAAVLTISYSPGMSHFSLFSLASSHYQISMEEEPVLFPWPGISPSLFHLAMVSAW